MNISSITHDLFLHPHELTYVEAEGVGGGRRHHPAMGKMESSPHPAEALLLVLGRHVHASPLPPVLSGTPLPSPDQTTNLLLHHVQEVFHLFIPILSRHQEHIGEKKVKRWVNQLKY